jgi:hypothetical protein
MIVSNTVTAALDCVALGAGAEAPTPGISPAAGAGAPHVGISPAKTETERTEVKAIVIRNLFIDVAPSM